MKNIRYSAVLILITAGAWAWWQGRAAFDDAYISFRYAMNLVSGDGLTFNPGFAVEGYSNLAWVLWTAVGLGLGADPLVFARILGVGAYLVSIGWLAHRFTPRLVGTHPIRLLGLAFFAVMIAPHGLATMAGSGLETAFVGALIVAIGLVEFVGQDRNERPRIFGTAPALAALVCLTRPEGPVVVAALTLGVALAARARGESSRVAAAWAGHTVALPLAVYLLQGAFRFLYYGRLLPNPYYAKGAESGQWEAGFAYLAAFVSSNPVAGVLIGLTLYGLWRGGRRERAALAYVASVTVLYLGYVLRVGGDFMQFRFMWQVWPTLFMGACIGLTCLLDRRTNTGVAVALLSLVLLGRDVHLEERFHMQSIEDMQRVTDTGWLVAPTLAEVLPDDTVISTTMIGVIGYASGLDVVDQWGLTEPYVRDAPQRKDFQRGHQKPAPVDYLESRGVNLYFDHPRICGCHQPCPMYEPTVLIRLSEGRCVASWLLGPTPKLTRHICEHPEHFISRPSICRSAGEQKKTGAIPNES